MHNEYKPWFPSVRLSGVFRRMHFLFARPHGRFLPGYTVLPSIRIPTLLHSSPCFAVPCLLKKLPLLSHAFFAFTARDSNLVVKRKLRSHVSNIPVSPGGPREFPCSRLVTGLSVRETGFQIENVRNIRPRLGAKVALTCWLDASTVLKYKQL